MLRRVAARQHGLIHRDQALRCGMTDSGIHRRVRSGTWVRHFRSVYAVAGAPETFEQRGLGACLSIGRGTALSHGSAGRMWGFCDGERGLEVTVRGSVTGNPPGVRVHRTQILARGDVGKLRGVPVTSPARTLIALAAVLPEAEVERALHAAVTGGCVGAAELRTKVLAESGRGRRGPAVLRRLVLDCGRRSHVVTPLEKVVHDVLTRGGLPPLWREYPVLEGGRVFYVDFAFPSVRVGVEADGRRWHSDADSFERDRQKHNALAAAGWTILRVTDREIRTNPEAVRAQVVDLVGAASGKRE